MSDTSPRLELPYLAPSQAQKHVTHNEALARLDILVQLVVEGVDANTPPVTATESEVWALGSAPTGDWTGQADMLAAWVNGGWEFIAPQTGWRALNKSDQTLIVRTDTGWTAPSASDLNGIDGVGINATFDSNNRLSVSSPATLLNHDGAGHQLKLNKAADTDTASLLFQTGFSGRAEMGTAGSDRFGIKVSADGTSWHTGLSVDAATGDLNVPNALTVDGPVNGTAVTQSAGDSTAGRLMKTGDGGILGNAVQVSGSADLHTRGLKSGLYAAVASVTGGLPETSAYWHSTIISERDGGVISGLSIRNTGNPSAQRAWFGSGGSSTAPINWTEIWHAANTTVDTNGFIKQASPIVRLSDDKTEEPVDPVGATFAKTGTGEYELRNVEPLSKSGWQIEVPQDANGNRLIFIETEYAAEARVLRIRTSAVLWEGRWIAGEAQDIPTGRWVDLRFQKTEEGGDL